MKEAIRLTILRHYKTGTVEVNLTNFYEQRVLQWFILNNFIEGSGSDPMDEANSYVLQLKLMFEQLGVNVEVVAPLEVKK